MKNIFGFVNKCLIFVLPSRLMVTKMNHMKHKQTHPQADMSPWVFWLVTIAIFYIVSLIEKF